MINRFVIENSFLKTLHSLLSSEMAKLWHGYFPLYAGVEDLLVVVNAFNEEYGIVVQQVLNGMSAFQAHVRRIQNGHISISFKIALCLFDVNKGYLLPEGHAFFVFGIIESGKRSILGNHFPPQITVIEDLGFDRVMYQVLFEFGGGNGLSPCGKSHHDDIKFLVLHAWIPVMWARKWNTILLQYDKVEVNRLGFPHGTDLPQRPL
jgi:hypothetical protein